MKRRSLLKAALAAPLALLFGSRKSEGLTLEKLRQCSEELKEADEARKRWYDEDGNEYICISVHPRKPIGKIKDLPIKMYRINLPDDKYRIVHDGDVFFADGITEI